MSDQPDREDARRFAELLEARMPHVRCVPGLQPDVTRPRTVKLGDTVVGAFPPAFLERVAGCV